MNIKQFQEIRLVCLKNAEDLISAAKALTDKNVDHIRYHLATLALEEIGKADILEMKHIAETHKKPDKDFNPIIDDHIKKLFWALWGPSFGREKITKEQVESYQRLAKTIHESRLYYLYTDPQIPILPQQKISRKEADGLVSLAETRMNLEKIKEIAEPDAQTADDLRWFLVATDDPEKRRHIFSNESLDKLVELEGSREWIKWLRELFEKADAEMQEILQKELKREKPSEAGAKQPKWKIKIRIYSDSHSIRPRALNKWNKHSDFIKLYNTNKKDELICEFILPKTWPVQGLWHNGWGLSRTFVTALNIATTGFFWWYVPKDVSRFYEEIWDLENNARVQVERSPILKIDWGHLALKEDAIPAVALVFDYLLTIRGTKKEEPLNSYIAGLTFLSKNDIHLQLEANAFEQFFQAFKSALLINGDWDGSEELKLAASRQLSDVLSTTRDLHSYIELGTEFEKTKKPPKEITLTEVIGMKLYCDIYFIKLAKKKSKLRTLSEEKIK